MNTGEYRGIIGALSMGTFAGAFSTRFIAGRDNRVRALSIVLYFDTVNTRKDAIKRNNEQHRIKADALKNN